MMVEVIRWTALAISSALCPQIYLRRLLALFLFATIARAIPIDYFPLNSQLPPVARVGEPFTFAFAPQTFFSALNMTYRLGDGTPAWLSLDSASRTLSGTPGKDDLPASGGDVVGVPISLIAQDATGEASTNATLVVSRNSTPRIAIPLSEQIPKLGPYSAPASLLLYPSHEFKFSFSRETFRIDDEENEDGHETENGEERSEPRQQKHKRKTQALNYYAVSGDNAPLPSWIQFDSSSLTFSGKTPPFESLVQPPETFTFQLVASDVVGFASAAIPFSIVVGNHELTTDSPVIKLNATRGRPFEYTDLPKILKIDKHPLQRTDVSSINATGLPRWLKFDEEMSWKVSGTPDDKAEPVNVTIAVVDNFLDTLNLTLEIDVDMALFRSDLPDLNVTAGDDFSFDLNKFLIKPSDTRMAFKSDPDEPWIHLDSTALILSGTAPQSLSKRSVNEFRLVLNATSKHAKHTETKNMSIHILPPKPTEPTPTPNPDAKDDSSRRNLLWLIIIPILLVCVGIIAFLFYLRRRRQGPNKINTREVSGPIPGSFVFNGPSGLTESSMRNIRRMVDTGPTSTGVRTSAQQGANTNAPATSNFTPSGESSNPSVNRDLPPHALSMPPGVTRLPQKGNVVKGMRNEGLAGQVGRVPKPPVKAEGIDDMSLLSDTSLGEAESHITEAQSSDISRKSGNEAFRGALGLEIPLIAEPFSIQPTPDLAYRAGGKYDMSSDDEAPPPIGYKRRPRSGRQQDASLGLRNIGSRLSKALKRGSASKLPEDVKRHSSGSSSSSQTTRTSILTSGVAEEATMSTAMNVVARPTVIHIPSRPGETRRVSRRSNETTPLFGGRSLTKSQRNFGLAGDGSPATVLEENPNPPPVSTDVVAAAPQDGETSWYRTARNSLGIAYKDLLGAGPETRRSFVGQKEMGLAASQSESWKNHHTSQELMSPDQWPVPNAFMGIAITSDAVRGKSKPPQLPPLASVDTSGFPTAPKEKGNGIANTRRASRGSGSYSIKSHAPSTRSRQNRRSSRDERLMISRSREQRVHAEFRAMMSQTPSPNYEWYSSDMRALPETPTRASRALLTDRLNEVSVGPEDRGMGLRSAPSKRSLRTARSAKSVRSVWAGEEDDDEAWEDVRPPESMIGGWGEEDSHGSFSVYI